MPVHLFSNTYTYMQSRIFMGAMTLLAISAGIVGSSMGVANAAIIGTGTVSGSG
jgi:hypothetical protein